MLDQLSKQLVARNIPLYDTIPVIRGFFNLVHIRNRGMAFGIMNRSEVGLEFYILVCATCLAVLILVYWILHPGDGEMGLKFGLSLILGGAVGNLIDRIYLKEVIDFLDFFIGHYHWPSFNMADSAITIGTILVAANIILFKTTDKKGAPDK